MQVHLQRKQLQAWLSAKKLPSIPIETFVVSTNPKAVLRAENKFLSDIVVRKSNLVTKIEALVHKHQQEIISKKTEKISKFIIKSTHTSYS